METADTQGLPRWLLPAGLAAFALLFGTYFVMQALSTPGAEQNISPVAQSGAVFEPPTAGTAIDPPRALSDFTLTNKHGEPMSLSDLQGKPALIYFGYTFCPDICPTTLADMTRSSQMLGEQADDVSLVFVSVDGERDTPARINQYLDNFDTDFVGLTGEPYELRQIAPEFGLYFEKREIEGTSADYLIDHGASTYLVDAEGNLRMLFSYGTPADVMTAEIEALLSEAAES